jgi:hypothetical protein
MQQAMDLLQEMGVPRNFECIRAIEEVVDAAHHGKQRRHEFEQGSSSRPSKRARVTPPLEAHIDWAEEVEAQLAAEVSDEEGEPAVSLGNSDVEDDLLDSIGYYGEGGSNEYVPSFLSPLTCTDESPIARTLTWPNGPFGLFTCILNYNMTICVHGVDMCDCKKCKGKGKGNRILPNIRDQVFLDSGASQHFINDLSMLYNTSKDEDFTVMTANGVTHTNEHGSCDLAFELPEDRTLHTYTLKDVHYLPSSHHLLILSLRQLLNDGLRIEGIADDLVILHGNQPLFHFMAGEEQNSLYYLYGLRRLGSRHFEAYLSISMDLAHKRFAHPSKKVLRKFPSATLGYPPVDGKLSSGPCSGCAQGKMHQRAYPLSSRRASKPFELIHSDLKSFPVESYHRYKYVIVFYDDYSSHAWISCLRQKSSAISATKQFIAMVNTYYESAVCSWMSDAGGEYKSDAFDNMLCNQGIKIFTSTPHTPQQNGRAERFMRTFMDKAESMHFTACIPQSWWEFSIEYAVQLYNRTPQDCLKWSTPFAMLHNGEKPHVDQFRVFGCGA